MRRCSRRSGCDSDNRWVLLPDIDKLFGHLGMKWDDYSIDAVNGRLPHDAALRLLAAVESHQLPPELNRGNARSALIDKRDKLLVLLHYYRNWYEHPDRVPTQMQQFVGSAPRHGRQDLPLTRVRAAALVAAGVNHEKRSA